MFQSFSTKHSEVITCPNTNDAHQCLWSVNTAFTHLKRAHWNVTGHMFGNSCSSVIPESIPVAKSLSWHKFIVVQYFWIIFASKLFHKVINQGVYGFTGKFWSLFITVLIVFHYLCLYGSYFLHRKVIMCALFKLLYPKIVQNSIEYSLLNTADKHTYLAQRTPWSRRRFLQGEAFPLHLGWADPCDYPKCG